MKSTVHETNEERKGMVLHDPISLGEGEHKRDEGMTQVALPWRS